MLAAAIADAWDARTLKDARSTNLVGVAKDARRAVTPIIKSVAGEDMGYSAFYARHDEEEQEDGRHANEDELSRAALDEYARQVGTLFKRPLTASERTILETNAKKSAKRLRDEDDVVHIASNKRQQLEHADNAEDDLDDNGDEDEGEGGDM